MDESESKVFNFINSIFPEDDKPLISYREIARNALALNTEEEINLYLELFIDILELSFSPEEANPYSSTFMFSDGRQSFDISDLTASEWDMVEKSVSCIKYLPLKARLADLLWLNKKQYQMAEKAVDCYISIFNAHYAKDSHACLAHIQRAYVLSCKLGKSGELYNRCCTTIKGAIIELDNLQAEAHFVLKLMLILQKNSFGNKEWGKEICERIISRAVTDNNIFQIEAGIKVKVGWLRYPPRDTGQIRLERIRLGKFYENFAASLEQNSTFRAVMFYENALLIYRQENCQEEEKRVRKLLESLKKEMHASLEMHSYSIETAKIQQYKQHINNMFKGRTLSEKIVLLGMQVNIHDKQKLKDIVIDSARKFLSHNMPKRKLDADGKTIINIPPLDIANPEKDCEILNLHMWDYSFNDQSIYGQFVWQKIQIITDEHTITERDLDFLINNNAFIPEGREKPFRKGVLLGLQGEYYLAMHLLIPQVENAFREFAKMCGALVTTFEDDKTEQAKVLTSIFYAPELVEAYDENILFALQGLLNEKAGANLRNRLAHGLLEDVSSPIYAYFLGVVIKLLVFYSPAAWEIYTVVKGT